MYLDEILVLTKGDCIDHVQMIKFPLNKLMEKDLNVIFKVFFRQTKIEYLGFQGTCDGIKHIDKKIQAIKI